MGTHQRSASHYREAIEYVQSGKLGKIRLVRAWTYLDWLDQLRVRHDGKPPEGVDYDMWLGPAPNRPFNANRFHFNFRWYWDYAGGLMTDWGAHMIDIANWGMGIKAPGSAMAIGGKFGYPHDAMENSGHHAGAMAVSGLLHDLGTCRGRRPRPGTTRARR